MCENKTVTLFAAAVVIGLAGIAMAGPGAGQAPVPANGAISGQERARMLAKGKDIFVEKCARCHNERGDKALRSGRPLNERGLATDAIARAVNGRLKDRTAEERLAVTLYIASLMK